MQRREFIKAISAAGTGLLLSSSSLSASAQQAIPSPDPGIKRVLIMFKCHFDAGFIDTQAAVVHKYFSNYFPHAIQIAADQRAQGGRPYVWTTGSWLLYEYLEQASPEERKRMDASRQPRRHRMARPALHLADRAHRSLDDCRIARHLPIPRPPLRPRHHRSQDDRCSRPYPRHHRSAGRPRRQVPRHRRERCEHTRRAAANFSLERHVGSDAARDVSQAVMAEWPMCPAPTSPSPSKCAATTAARTLPPKLQLSTPTSRTASLTPKSPPPASPKSPTPSTLIAAPCPSSPRKSATPGFTASPAIRSKSRAIAKSRGCARSGSLKASSRSPTATDLALLRHVLLEAEHTWGTDTKTWLDFDHYKPADLAAMIDTKNYKVVQFSWVEKRQDLLDGVATLPAPLREEASQAIAALDPVEPRASAKAARHPAAEAIETKHFSLGIDRKDRSHHPPAQQKYRPRLGRPGAIPSRSLSTRRSPKRTTTALSPTTSSARPTGRSRISASRTSKNSAQ